ncbi:hypothetical protein BKA57DRAFT_467740 [Linnemannia elongata]|nr:hypothetical protein BKA57DRAFT_467740 [Linnemannia elongata]
MIFFFRWIKEKNKITICPCFFLFIVPCRAISYPHHWLLHRLGMELKNSKWKVTSHLFSIVIHKNKWTNRDMPFMSCPIYPTLAPSLLQRTFHLCVYKTCVIEQMIQAGQGT